MRCWWLGFVSIVACGSPEHPASAPPAIVAAADPPPAASGDAGAPEAESLAGRAPRLLDDARARELDAFFTSAAAQLAVPGAAIAVVRDGAVIYERAFGVRALGGTAPVTPATLFLVGSVTKPMTTLMQAALVDAGLFTWTTPVTSLLPSFALGDAGLTRELAVWHMSCGCTGMPRRDLEHIFEYERVTPEARLASMREMTPTTKLGETFQYSNLMVAAGGYITAHAASPKASLGDAYDTAMRARVFEPIGMTSTTLDFAAATRGDHARPHAAALDGTVRAVPLGMERNVVPIRPAGGVWSNLRDLERYAMTELAGGVAPGGRRVVSEANLHARRIPRTGDATDGYGLGLGVGVEHGLAVVSHDGGAFGYGASLYLLPEHGLGIVVLTNVRNGAPGEYLPFNAVVKRRVLEAVFDARPLAAQQLAGYAKAIAAGAATAAASVEPVEPARVRPLAGAYAHAALGTVTLALGPRGLVFDAGEWQGTLGQRRTPDGGLVLVFLDPPFAGGELVVGGDAAQPTLTVDYAGATYVFRRPRP